LRCVTFTHLLSFVCRSAFHRLLRSFPTRRSSDLLLKRGGASTTLTTASPACQLPTPYATPTTRGSSSSYVKPKDLTRGRRPTSSDRKSTRLNSSHVSISYAVFCLKTKIQIICIVK